MDMITFVYPENIVGYIDKLEYCYIAQEKLRLVHNEQGELRRIGKISKDDFDRWVAVYFSPCQIAVSEEIIQQRKQCKASGRWVCEIDKTFKVKE